MCLSVDVEDAVERCRASEGTARAIDLAQGSQGIKRDFVWTNTNGRAIFLMETVKSACAGAFVVLLRERPTGYCERSWAGDLCQRTQEKRLEDPVNKRRDTDGREGEDCQRHDWSMELAGHFHSPPDLKGRTDHLLFFLVQQ